ncbi:MAG: UvrB/UvrC motif-containing protein, partial [Phycisphaeraceae bacterium]|nr:UvrB/UvrC motif-containing protein [Phycisphaeraceae bacterium]
MERMRQKARELPRTPGVYLMKDDKGRVIYVGKAAKLADRVSSYFLPSTDLGPKKQPMLSLVVDFDIIACEGEWEALLTENRLIKDIHPKFNVLLTDGKSYPYLVITMKDDFPGVFITRTPADEQFKGGKILGPFTSVFALREAIQLLQRVFRFRTCHLDIREDDEKRRFFRPCLLYAIRQCTGPCAARISKEDYRRDIDRFVRFIESKRSHVLRDMKQQMMEHAENQRYEDAAVLRDQIRAIEKLDQRGKKGQRWQPENEVAPIDPRKGAAA